jgi:hypothetical protein
MARTKSIPYKHISAGNQRTARKSPVPKSGKKIVTSRKLEKKGKKGAMRMKGKRIGLVKKSCRRKPGRKL